LHAGEQFAVSAVRVVTRVGRGLKNIGRPAAHILFADELEIESFEQVAEVGLVFLVLAEPGRLVVRRFMFQFLKILVTLLLGAAGGFKEVIVATGVGDYINDQVTRLPLSRVAVAFFVAALMRIALGSATASILAASAVLAKVAGGMPGMETLLVLAVACGVNVGTQPADSGFWMIKEYGNLSARDVMLRFNLCRLVMALAGLGILLAVEAWWPH
jgi:hypothetical protein